MTNTTRNQQQHQLQEETVQRLSSLESVIADLNHKITIFTEKLDQALTAKFHQVFQPPPHYRPYRPTPPTQNIPLQPNRNPSTPPNPQRTTPSTHSNPPPLIPNPPRPPPNYKPSNLSFRGLNPTRPPLNNTPLNLPFHRLSHAQKADRTARDLCINCNDRLDPGHVCNALRFYEVLANEGEGESFEETPPDPEPPPKPLNTPTITFHASRDIPPFNLEDKVAFKSGSDDTPFVIYHRRRTKARHINGPCNAPSEPASIHKELSGPAHANQPMNGPAEQ